MKEEFLLTERRYKTTMKTILDLVENNNSVEKLKKSLRELTDDIIAQEAEQNNGQHGERQVLD